MSAPNRRVPALAIAATVLVSLGGLALALRFQPASSGGGSGEGEAGEPPLAWPTKLVRDEVAERMAMAGVRLGETTKEEDARILDFCLDHTTSQFEHVVYRSWMSEEERRRRWASFVATPPEERFVYAQMLANDGYRRATVDAIYVEIVRARRAARAAK